ncbi:MAG: DNA polymerase III subunit delta [Pyrinomonadaceae bacterium]
MKIHSREDLRRQLQQKEFAPVYLLFGVEKYLRDLAAKTLTDFLLKESSLREFNETVFTLNNDNLMYALASAEQLPMMASRRVIKVVDVRISANSNKDNLKEENEDLLASYFKRPAKTSVIIFVADELDKRRKMAKLLIDNSVAVEFTELNNFELLKWANDELRKTDVTADRQTLDYLLTLTGSNLSRLNNELEKLSTAVLPDKIITTQLIDSLVPNTKELSNFDLTDSLISKNKTQTFQILDKILSDGSEPLMILGLIANNFRRISLAKELMASGAGTKEVFRLIKMPPSKHDNFIVTARRTERKKLAKIMKRISETDLAIKTSKGTPQMQIEMLVSEILNF